MIEWIAELGNGHNGSLDRALKLIGLAAAAGATAVKFQLFRIDKMFAPEILSRSPAHRARAKYELPLEWLPALRERSKALGLSFGCTPCHLEAVEQLRPYVDFYKIASYELTWHELIGACAQTGKQLILSTGMATLDEVKDAARVAMTAGGLAGLSVLHCVSNYPAGRADCNLSAIRTLRNGLSHRIAIGYSDHTGPSDVVRHAIDRWRAEIIELHLCDDQGEPGSWTPSSMLALTSDYQRRSIDGDGIKRPQPCELQERRWRRDPSDGLRPMKELRKEFYGEEDD